MTLILRPIGRGNWRPVPWLLDEARLPPMLIKVGDRFTLGGLEWRVSKVLP